MPDWLDIPAESIAPIMQTPAHSSRLQDGDTANRSAAGGGNPKTGEMSVVPFWLMLFLTPTLAACTLALVKKRQNLSKRTVSLLLVLSLAVSMARISVRAGAPDEKADSAPQPPSADTTEISLSAEKAITIDGEAYTVKVVVTGEYQNADKEYFEGINAEAVAIPEGTSVDPTAFGEARQDDDPSGDAGTVEAPSEIGSVAGDKNLF